MRAPRRLHATLAALAALAALALVAAPGAAAEPMGMSEWLSSSTDADGVPLDHYQTLPLDRGDIFHPMLSALAAVMSFFWGFHFNVVTTLLWLLEYLLSFEWVDLLVGPIQPMAEQIQSMLSQLQWIPLATTVAGATIGLLFIAGRRNQGWGELVLTVTMVVLATGALMNPVTWITGPDGMLEKSQTFGAQVAVELAGGDSSEVESASDASAALNETVVRDLATLLLRHPAQATTFGHTLEGECDKLFTEKVSAADPLDTKSTTVRDAISRCDGSAKTYVSSEDFFKPAMQLFMGAGVLVVLALGFVLAVVFIVSVLLALFYGVWQMGAVLIAILPSTSRTSFLRAFFGVLACMAVIIATTVLTAGTVNLLVSVLQATSGLGPILQMIILFLVTVALIALILKVRRDLHKKGKSMADWVGRMGLSRNKEPKPSKLAKFPQAIGQLGRDELNRRLMVRRMNKAGGASKAQGESGGGEAPAGAGSGTGGGGAGRGPSAPPAFPRALPAGGGPRGPRRPGAAPSSGPSGAGSAAWRMGKAVVGRRLAPRGPGTASTQGRLLRGAGMAASVVGGPAGLAGGLAADYLAARADRQYRARRIAVDSKGQGRVVPARPEVIEGEIIEDHPVRPTRPQPARPSLRAQQIRAELTAARGGSR